MITKIRNQKQVVPELYLQTHKAKFEVIVWDFTGGQMPTATQRLRGDWEW